MAGQAELPKCLVIGHPKYVGTLVGELKHSRQFAFSAVPLDFTQFGSNEDKSQSLVGIKEDHGTPFGIVIQLSHFGKDWEEALEFLKAEFPTSLLFAFWVSSGHNGSAPTAQSIKGLGVDAVLVSTGPFRQAILEFLQKKLNESLTPAPVRKPDPPQPPPAPPKPNGGGFPFPPAATLPPHVPPPPEETEGRDAQVALPRSLTPPSTEGKREAQPIPPVAATIKEVLTSPNTLLLLALAEAAEAFARVIRSGTLEQVSQPTALATPVSEVKPLPLAHDEKFLIHIRKEVDTRFTQVTLGKHVFTVSGNAAKVLATLHPTCAPNGCTRVEMQKMLDSASATALDQTIFQLRNKMNQASEGLGKVLVYERASQTYRLDFSQIPP